MKPDSGRPSAAGRTHVPTRPRCKRLPPPFWPAFGGLAATPEPCVSPHRPPPSSLLCFSSSLCSPLGVLGRCSEWNLRRNCVCAAPTRRLAGSGRSRQRARQRSGSRALRCWSFPPPPATRGISFRARRSPCTAVNGDTPKPEQKEIKIMANAKPIAEVRIGNVKAAIWKNATENSARYNVTLRSLYKDGDAWKTTQSFGRDDLLVLAKVADLAHSRIYDLQREGGSD